MSRTIAAFLTLLFAQLLLPLPSRADDSRAYQAAIIRSIFDRLTAAAGDGRHAQPKLSIDTLDGAAEFDRNRLTLYVDVNLFDLCRGVGGDSINALAAVMSHELAHYYLDHGRGDGYARKDARARMHAAIDWRVTQETEADFHGGIYAHLAGYDPYIVPELLDMLYDHYGYTDDDPRYLSRDQRKDVAIRVSDSLSLLIPIFDIATYLTLSRCHVLARSCYDYLIARFPSREMFNNTGTVSALQAMTILGGPETNFTYPFELDEDTRLSSVKITRGSRDRGTRSPSHADSVFAMSLLENAVDRFRAAVERDPAYGPAQINLASVLILQGKLKPAIDLVQRIVKRDGTPRVRLLSRIVEAIAEGRSGHREKARQMLNAIAGSPGAEALGPLIKANLAVLDSGSVAPPFGRDVFSSESVDGIKVSDTAVTTYATRTGISELVGGDSALTVIARQRDYSTMLRAQTGSTLWQFLCTASNYSNRSGRGITIGSPVDSVLAQYGPNPRVVNGPGGSYYIYDTSKMIFLVGDDGRVSRWIAYTLASRTTEPPPSGTRNPFGSRSGTRGSERN